MMKKIRAISVLSFASCLLIQTVFWPSETGATFTAMATHGIQARNPEPGTQNPSSHSLNPGEKHTYPLKLKPRSFLKVTLEQKGIDVVLRLVGPDGKKLCEENESTGRYDTEKFSRIFDQAGRYILEVESLNKTDLPGRYEVKIEGMRVATDQDRAQVEIEQLIADAGKLRRGGKYTEAVPLIEKALSQSEKIFGPEHPLVGESLIERGVLHYEQGTYAEAKGCYDRARAIKEKEFGKEHRSIASLLNNLASTALMSGQYEVAESLFVQCRTMQEKTLGPECPEVASTLNNLAALYWRKGNFAKAESLLQQALSLKEKLYGPDHEETGFSLNSLAVMYYIRGNVGKAEPLFVRALAIQEKTLGPDHPSLATTLNNLGTLYQRKKEYETAEAYLLRALDIRRKTLGVNHTEVGISLNNLAVLYRETTNYTQAMNYYLEAIRVQEKALGATHPEVAKPLAGLAVMYQQRGEYAKALPLLERSLAIIEQKFGPDHPDVTTGLNNLAVYYQDVGDFVRAETLYRRSLAIREKALGLNHSNTALSLTNLAVLLHARGNFKEAETVHRQALVIREKIFGSDHPEVASSLGNLAALLKDTGDYAASLLLQERALAIWEKTMGPDHPNVGLCLHNLGGLYYELGDRKKAVDFHLRALAVFEKKLDPVHRHITQTLISLGATYNQAGDFDQAEQYFKRALANLEKTALSDNPLMINCLNNLATLYKRKGELPNATACFQRALAMAEKQVGRQHPGTATILSNLGVLSFDARDFGQAERLHQESLTIREHLLGPDHSDVVNTLDHLTSLYQLRGDLDLAIRYRIQCNEAAERNIARNLNSGSERQKMIFLQKTAHFLHQTISLHQHEAVQNQVAANVALTEIVRRKGRALDAMTSTIATLRSQSDSETQRLLDEYAALVSQISTLTLSEAKGKPFNNLQDFLKDLNRRQETLEIELSRRSAEFKAQTFPVTLEAIQKLIPPDAVLIEFAVYYPWNVPLQKYDKLRYVAYTLTQDGAIQSADLGEAEPIDAAISEFRKVLGTSHVVLGTNRDLGQPLTQKTKVPTVLAQARRVDQLVMSPVRKLIGTARHLLISPDGALNLIPFSALVTEKGKYLVEEHLITYLTSGRDLLRLQVKIPTHQSALVVADPDYAEGQGPILAGRAMKPLTPLPGTGREGKDIQPLIQGSRLVLQTEATKEVVQKTRRPEILHIATHGYFLEDTARDRSEAGTRVLERVEFQEEKPITIQNPLLRSWLFFAGANRDQAAERSGIMTALEASQLDLWGTKLVVLSACETGVGEIRNGDGVFGLRRALVLAGSESQMMSLWSVSDIATRELMVEYYARLKAGEGRSEALRNAQLKMLKDVRRRHPFYWASFIQSGEWKKL
ncbi:MAG TPA: CHAT domain-containing protein [Acidobacteriota bacterium]|nr:CHAT domain-containing protein [Acidobacteriota bacterium]